MAGASTYTGQLGNSRGRGWPRLGWAWVAGKAGTDAQCLL